MKPQFTNYPFSSLADSSHTSHVSGCFSTDSTVLTESGEHKAMSELAIGDKVLSMSDAGEAIYSEVVMFLDRNLQQSQEFVRMRTETNEVLTVTPAHLIMVWNPQKQLSDYVFADRIELGDYVLVHNKQGVLQPQKVVDLKAVHKRGIVAPLTAQGTIVVDSVAASCYAILKSHSLAHWSLTPMRWGLKFKSWMPEKLRSTAENKAVQSSGSQQNGIHWYAKSLYALKDYVLPKTWQYQ